MKKLKKMIARSLVVTAFLGSFALPVQARVPHHNKKFIERSSIWSDDEPNYNEELDHNHNLPSSYTRAIARGNVNIVRLWLASGVVDINEEDMEGKTALMIAAEKGCVNILNLLLDRGANPGIRDEDGWTALMFAVSEERFEVVKALLERSTNSADLNLKDKDGWTALMIAAENGNDALVKLLLEKGADVSVKSKRGNTALIIAAREGNKSVVSELLNADKSTIDLQSNEGYTALMYAANEGYLEIVNELLASGADPNLTNNKGGTALMYAVGDERLDVVKLLLNNSNNNADPNMKDKKGLTALMLAATKADTRVLEALLNSSKIKEDPQKVNLCDNEGRSAFTWATIKQNTPALKILCEHRADPNIPDQNGNTPLIRAVICSNIDKEKRLDIISHLLRCGADTDLQNDRYESALMWAIERGNVDVVKLFIEEGRVGSINFVNQRGITPLTLAARRKQVQIVKLLLDTGKTSRKNRDAARIVAVTHKYQEIVDLLDKYIS